VTGLLAAATAAGLCTALLCAPSPRRLLRSRGAGARARGWTGARPVAPRSVLLAPVAVLCAALLVGVLGPSAVLLCASAALVAAGAVWLHAGGRRRRAAEQGRRQTIEACDALVAELAAGQPATRALQRTAEQHPALWPAARAGMLGGDVAAALRGASAAPGSAGLGSVGSAWQVAEGSGAGLVTALQRVAESLRADDAVQAEVAAALAPARATARLLAVLPVFGLLLGSGIGGDPLGLLLRTAGGNALLLAGVVLALSGTVWVERLADRVQV
jgi:tight adherence protein B